MKQKKIVYKTEEQNEMIKFFIVLIVVVILIVGVYFLSKVLIKEEVKDLTYTTGTVSTTAAIVGTILNQQEKIYYVLAYDSESTDAASYRNYAGYYTSSDSKNTKVYYVDLSNGMNKKYYVKEGSNPKAKKIEDLKMIDGTLLKIENGKITKYLEGMEAIKKELKVKEENK